MKVLLLGGTGAMGVHVSKLLAEKNIPVTVTSRKERENTENITYVTGNAKEMSFLKTLCDTHWDVILDFMVYTVDTLKERIDLLLSATEQYIFFSSARVYADGEAPLCEDAPRLLDVCKDAEYLKTSEYALEKAREENVLFACEKKNWTIVRPSLTYGEQRLQLGVYEKENWLYRALHGRSIVFSKDLLDKHYTLTYAGDVAKGIVALVGDERALGETYHIVVEKAYTWREILETYIETLEQVTGAKPKVVLTELSTNLQLERAKYQVLYGRYFDRKFDNKKIRGFADVSSWKDAKEGLSMCLTDFLAHPVFLNIDWAKEGLIDRAAKEWTPLSEIPGFKNKLVYCKWRFGIGARNA